MNQPDPAAVQVIRQALYAATNIDALSKEAAANIADPPTPALTVAEALDEGIDVTVASALDAAGFFERTEISDEAAAAQIDQLQKEVDAYHDFAQRLAEAAEIAPDSPLVDSVEDLVDEILTRILGPDDPAITGETDA